MSETKFTPGPWEAQNEKISGVVDPLYFTITAGEGFCVPSKQDVGFGLRGYMNKANADLIASAPDLYAENAQLRAALQNLIDEQNGPPLETRRAQWEAAMNDAKAILSK